MAGLHNFSEREQEENEGKMESKKGRGVLLVRGEVKRRLFFLFEIHIFKVTARVTRSM